MEIIVVSGKSVNLLRTVKWYLPISTLSLLNNKNKILEYFPPITQTQEASYLG